MKKRRKVTSTVATSTLLHLISFFVFCIGYEEEEEDYGYSSHMRQASLELNVTEVLIMCCALCVGYEEEEEDYGYPSHMRQASLELNVTEVASPRGSSGKRSCTTLKFGLHIDMPDLTGMCKIDCSGETGLVLHVSSSS